MPEEKSTKSSGDLIAQLEPYFTKQAPFQIPKNGQAMIVQWLPWISVVMGAFALFAAFSLFLLLTGANLLTGGLLGASIAASGTGPLMWLSFLALIAQGAINIYVFPGLKKKSMSAWTLLFWVDIVFFVYNVLTGLSNPLSIVGSLFGALLGLVVGLYILFQIKSHYK